jgi:hypothetical protein
MEREKMLTNGETFPTAGLNFSLVTCASRQVGVLDLSKILKTLTGKRRCFYYINWHNLYDLPYKKAVRLSVQFLTCKFIKDLKISVLIFFLVMPENKGA